MPQSWTSAIQGVGERALFLPRKVILLGRLDGPVAQALGVVARHQPLHRGEKVLDEDFLLVVEVLADAFAHGDRGALQLQHAERDAVDVQHHVRTFGVVLPGGGARQRDLLGDSEAVPVRALPVNQPDRLIVLSDVSLDLHAIAQQLIHGAVAVVEALAGVGRRYG